MRTIAEQRDVRFLPKPNAVSMILSDTMPPVSLITSAFGLVFSPAGLLMTNLRQRGWDIPGGHLEPGESPEQAMQREVREETGVDVRPTRLLGYQRIRITGPVPDGYRYPVPESYQVLFLAKAVRARDHPGDAEASEARYWPVEEAVSLPWVQRNRALFDAAVAQSSSAAKGSGA